ncbi:MAG TPA: HlyD family secretion protein [Terriglobales bacterium]|nr:HlyD family secretion protein [Terriglobales bacterium]
MATAQERPREMADEQEPRVTEGRLRVEPKREGEQDDQNTHRAASPAPPEDLEKTREEEEAAARTAQRKTRIKKIAPVVLVVLAVSALVWWLHARQYEDTDDAQVDGHISQIGPRIGGYITAVHVEDNQEVQPGQLLVEIDPRDYQVALARAQAEFADSQAQAAAAKYNVPITSVATASQTASARADISNAQAALAAAQKNLDAAKAKEQAAIATNAKAQADVQRYKPLVERDVISKQQYDAAVATATSTAADVQSAHDGVIAADAGITQAEARLAQAQANLRSALTGPRQVNVTEERANSAQSTAAKNKAALEQAQLNLQYTNITSPLHGIVGHRTAEVGQYLQPGQALMSLVDIDNVWITANFKETQLKNMKPGQPVDVRVDATGRDYKGKVLAIGGASGARFSLFPPENATGNYVKVVQRIPVRIVLDPDQNKDHLLRPGMSVEPKVKVR